MGKDADTQVHGVKLNLGYIAISGIEHGARFLNPRYMLIKKLWAPAPALHIAITQCTAPLYRALVLSITGVTDHETKSR